MNNLERAKELAQRTADRAGKPMAVLNLNRFSPLYVVREHSPQSVALVPVYVAQPAAKD